MNDERLLRLIEGTLPDEDAARLRARLEEDAALRERVETLRGMRALLQDSAPASFGPGFRERVAQRTTQRTAPAPAAEDAPTSSALDALLADVLYGPLQGLFPRVALACLLAIAGLGVSNASVYGSMTSSFLSAVFGLPGASITEALYYAGL